MEDRRFLYKHAGKEYAVEFEQEDTFQDLKRKIEGQTNILAKRQKVLGVKTNKGTLPADEDQLVDCLLKPGQRYMVLGQPEAVVLAASIAPEEPDLINDLLDVNNTKHKGSSTISEAQLEDALQKRRDKATVRTINPPRRGMKCLVLDIDYTFFDMSSVAERPSELLRPYLHELLKEVYPYYDIVIWSATSMRWIEIKLRELGISNNPDYKISMLMDGTCMVAVNSSRKGRFTIKPLKLLWDLQPGVYTPQNTIMVDDLKHNFICNLRNAYVIPAYKHCHRTRATDTELRWLKYYLLLIKDKRDLRKLDHSRGGMKAYVASHVLPSELRLCTHPEGEDAGPALPPIQAASASRDGNSDESGPSQHDGS